MSKRTEKKIAKLVSFKTAGEQIAADKLALIESVKAHQQAVLAQLIPAELLEIYLKVQNETEAQIADVHAEFSDKESALEANVAKLKAEISNEVLKVKESVKAEGLQVVYTSGKNSWDSKGLEGYAKINKEVLDFLKVGNPYVSFRFDK